MYLQTLHRRPIAGGYTSCLPPLMEERAKKLPFLKLIFEGRPEVKLEVEAGLEQVLAALPVQVVVLHLDRERERLEQLAAEHRGTPEARLYNPEKGTPAKTLQEVRAALRHLWGEPFYSDAAAELYKRP
jgi:hypothetical protein